MPSSLLPSSSCLLCSWIVPTVTPNYLFILSTFPANHPVNAVNSFEAFKKLRFIPIKTVFIFKSWEKGHSVNRQTIPSYCQFFQSLPRNSDSFLSKQFLFSKVEKKVHSVTRKTFLCQGMPWAASLVWNHFEEPAQVKTAIDLLPHQNRLPTLLK